MGSPRVAPLFASAFIFFFFFSVQLVLLWSETQLVVSEYEEKKVRQSPRAGDEQVPHP